MAAFSLGTAIWPEHNPLVDDHVVLAVVLVGMILATAGRDHASARSGSGST